MFFAPRDNPQIAGVVFAEHGEHGSAAAPIAKHVMETFFAKQDGRPLPVLPPATTAVRRRRRDAGDAAADAAPATPPRPPAAPSPRSRRPRAEAAR